MAVMYWIMILAIFRVVSSDTEDDKEKLRKDLNNIKEKLHGMQGDTEDFSKSLDEFSNGLDKYIKKEDDEEAYNDKLSKASAIVLGASLAIPKFKSGEPDQILSGVLDMTSMALTTFGGSFGSAAAVFVNVVSSMIGLFMSTPESSPSLDQVMAEALDEFQDKRNDVRMNTFIDTLSKVHNGIVATRNLSKEIEGKDLTAEDITHLKTEVHLFTSDTLLGEVKHGIANEIESGTVSDAERALATLNLYCKLTIVVELVLVEVMNYIREEGPMNAKLPTFYHAFMTRSRKADRRYFGFLHFPEMKQALSAVMYQTSPGKYPELQQYIKEIKVDPIPELGFKNGDTIYLTPKSWPQWFFYLSSEGHSLIYGSTNLNNQSMFKLSTSNYDWDGRQWELENVYYNDYFLTASKYDNCKPDPPNAEVSYVHGLTKDYMNKISSRCDPICALHNKCIECYRNCYSALSVGNHRHLVSYNFVWRFTKVKSSGSSQYYLISATQRQFGVEYSLFMKNSKNANAYLKYGNPGEDGMFKLTNNRRK